MRERSSAEKPTIDIDASINAADAYAALHELASVQVAFGYSTATVTVKRSTLRMHGCRSSGRCLRYMRQPTVSTLNLASTMPLSKIWAGPERNAHLDGPPLIDMRADGSTPFRPVRHISNVGHTLVAGPTGIRKAILLATLAIKFRRYHGSRIFAFDMEHAVEIIVKNMLGLSPAKAEAALAVLINERDGIQPDARLEPQAADAVVKLRAKFGRCGRVQLSSRVITTPAFSKQPLQSKPLGPGGLTMLEHPPHEGS